MSSNFLSPAVGLSSFDIAPVLAIRQAASVTASTLANRLPKPGTVGPQRLAH